MTHPRSCSRPPAPSPAASPQVAITKVDGRFRLDVFGPELLHTDELLLHQLMTVTDLNDVTLHRADGTMTSLDLDTDRGLSDWTSELLDQGLRHLEGLLRARSSSPESVRVRLVPNDGDTARDLGVARPWGAR